MRVFVLFMLFAVLVALGTHALADEVYPVEIVVTTTSDWTDVALVGASLVIFAQEVLEGADAPGLQVAALASMSIGKSSYEETRVAVRFDAYLADPADWLQIRITKGHIGRTTVAVYAPGGAEPLISYTHVGVSPSSDPANPRTFDVRATEITRRVAPKPLETPSAATFGGQKVLAFYYPWYGAPDGPSGRWVHWNPNRWHHDSAHVPTAGLYDSNDPDTVRRHIAEARAAGIDGFVVSWWGPFGFEDRAFDVVATVAAEEGFSITIYYEEADSPAEIVSDLAYFLARHGSNPALLRVDGKPAIFFYVRVTQRFTLAQWESVLGELERRDRPVFAIADGLRSDFLTVFDGVHTYNPVGLSREDAAAQYEAASLLARAQARLFAATVLPGYDEAYKNPALTYLDREDGETYRAYWALARGSAPHWILITSFNEWHEGSEIEPSVEFGTTYLEITADEAAAWKRGEPAPSAEPDRDGDGVPDSEDYCPDFPGRAITNGC